MNEKIIEIKDLMNQRKMLNAKVKLDELGENIDNLQEKLKIKNFQYGQLTNKYRVLKEKKDLFVKKLKEEMTVIEEGKNYHLSAKVLTELNHSAIDKLNKEVFSDE